MAFMFKAVGVQIVSLDPPYIFKMYVCTTTEKEPNEQGPMQVGSKCCALCTASYNSERGNQREPWRNVRET